MSRNMNQLSRRQKLGFPILAVLAAAGCAAPKSAAGQDPFGVPLQNANCTSASTFVSVTDPTLQTEAAGWLSAQFGTQISPDVVASNDGSWGIAKCEPLAGLADVRNHSKLTVSGIGDVTVGSHCVVIKSVDTHTLQGVNNLPAESTGLISVVCVSDDRFIATPAPDVPPTTP